MKQKHVLYGVIAGLAVLLYFKFGRKKEQGVAQTGGSGSGGGRTGIAIGEPNPKTGGEMGVAIGEPNQNTGNCGNFTVWYGQVKNYFMWNNGSPKVTKTVKMQYPSTQGAMLTLTQFIKPIAPVTKNLTIAEYAKGCTDHKSGNFTAPPLVSGVNPNPIIIEPVYNYIPKSGELGTKAQTEPIKVGFYSADEVTASKLNASGADLDGDILSMVKN